ncbi:MAG: CotH kinase family protein, partial [Bdellovibrionales bacterium]|nr:CotH kinase family protein [Bdellovibrionales bacterium]
LGPLALLLLLSALTYGYGASWYRSQFDFRRFSTATSRANVKSLDFQQEFNQQSTHRSKAEAYNAITQRPSKPKGSIPNVELYIPEQHLHKWKSFREKPKGMPYVTAQVRTWGNDFEMAKVRVRGDHSYHWGNDYPSLRVKMPEGKSFMGFRTFNLIHPRSTSGFERFIGIALAQELNLLHENGYIVRVFVNGKYWGFFQYISELDEQWIRRNRVLPGDVYSGEKEPRSKAIGVETYDTPKDVWYNIDYWKKVSYNNSIMKTDFSVLQEAMDILKEVIEDPSQSNREKLEAHFEVDEFLKMFALETYIGSKHFDRHHNWKILHDPSTGKLRPIVWDLWGHGHGGSSLDEDLFWPLALPQRAMLKFADLQNKKNYFIYQLFQIDKEKKISQSTLARLQHDVSKEFKQAPKIARPLWMRVDPWTIIATNEEVMRKESHNFKSRIKHFIEERSTNLEKVFHSCSIQAHRDHNNSSNNIEVQVHGNCGFKILNLQTPKETLAEINQSMFPLVTIEPYASGHSRYKATAHKNVRSIAGTGGMFDRSEQLLEVENLVTKENFSIQIQEAQKEKTEINEFAQMLVYNTGYIPNTHRRTQTLGPGKLTFTETTVFDALTDVVMLPDTRIQLGSNVSLIFLGQVTAVGKIKKPIIVERLHKNLHWGSLVFNGGKVSLGYFQAQGGSVYGNSLMKYSGMVSMYNCPVVKIANSRFAENSVGDDLVNIKNSPSISINQSTFEQALFDALDIDYGKGKVSNSIFRNSGNDLMDFMGSDIDINKVQLSNSGDKGISIGESSTVIVKDSIFRNMALGLAAKDQSLVYILENQFESVDLEIDAYQKSKYYGGSMVVAPRLDLLEKRRSDPQSIFTNVLEIPTLQKDPEVIVPIAKNIKKISARLHDIAM